MNKRIKTKWLEALRSGRYEQTTGGLKHRSKFCCLGVLCDILTEDPEFPTELRGKKTDDPVYRYKGKDYYISIDGALSDDIGLGYTDRQTLLYMNDHQQNTFTEIADWIDTTL